jgi:hypothetical protein
MFASNGEITERTQRVPRSTLLRLRPFAVFDYSCVEPFPDQPQDPRASNPPYQLMETCDRRLLEEWMINWNDLVDFEVHVITSKDAAEIIGPRL